MLAQKGQHKVAIEIQWSGQTGQETLYRQERYRLSGVRCLWLFRRQKFPASEDLPAVCVSGDIAGGFEARLDGQAMPLHEFLDAVFARRFRYGIPLGSSANIRVHSGVLRCWRCKARTRIVTFIEFLVGPHRGQFTVPDLNEFSDLLAPCRERISRASCVGTIKPRYSRTQEQSYMSNGCYHCDALVGEHFEHDAWDDESG